MSASAASSSVGGITGTAQATTQGASGTAEAQSSGLGAGQSAVGKAFAPTTPTPETVMTQANVAGAWYGNPPTGSNGHVAYSDVLSSPTSATVSSILGTTHANVVGALRGSTVLSAGLMGANYFTASTGSNGTYTYTAGGEFVYTLSGSHRFTLGLLDMGLMETVLTA
ncbi:MAG: hypothetical protein ACYDHY_14070 [Acidiferrobacterales bacterium]